MQILQVGKIRYHKTIVSVKDIWRKQNIIQSKNFLTVFCLHIADKSKHQYQRYCNGEQAFFHISKGKVHLFSEDREPQKSHKYKIQPPGNIQRIIICHACCRAKRIQIPGHDWRRTKTDHKIVDCPCQSRKNRCKHSSPSHIAGYCCYDQI